MDAIRTRIGRAHFDDYDHHGLRVYRDLSGRTSYLGLVAFAITGRRLSRDDEAVLDDIAVCSHVAEPRVWPIKLARVVASVGRAVPGYVAGTIALDSDLIGGRMTSDVTRLVLAFEAFLASGDKSDDDVEGFVASYPRLSGFGVPVRPADERLVALRAALSKRGRTTSRYWRVVDRLVEVVRKTRRLEPNVLVGFTATLLDLGFRVHEISAMSVVLFQPTFLANAVEGAEQRAAVLRALPPEAVRYEGPAPRVSPRAAARHAAPLRPPTG